MGAYTLQSLREIQSHAGSCAGATGVLPSLLGAYNSYIESRAMSVIGCSVAQGAKEVLTAPASPVLVWGMFTAAGVFRAECLASLAGCISP